MSIAPGFGHHQVDQDDSEAQIGYHPLPTSAVARSVAGHRVWPVEPRAAVRPALLTRVRHHLECIHRTRVAIADHRGEARLEPIAAAAAEAGSTVEVRQSDRSSGTPTAIHDDQVEARRVLAMAGREGFHG